jgi:hypothetical protein
VIRNFCAALTLYTLIAATIQVQDVTNLEHLNSFVPNMKISADRATSRAIKYVTRDIDRPATLTVSETVGNYNEHDEKLYFSAPVIDDHVYFGVALAELQRNGYGEVVAQPGAPPSIYNYIGEDDREVAPGETGEIVGRGRLVMAGYHARDEANREAPWVDSAGAQWLRTGDLGRIDADGFLYIVDRKKDMILSDGQNLYPIDIESVMNEHPLNAANMEKAS